MLETSRDEARAHIVAVAAELLATGGRDAVSTRAVAAAAGTQAPTIYRLFGDKDGLLDAIAEHGFTSYVAQELREPHSADPVEDFRVSWHRHVEFGLANPALFVLMYGDPKPGKLPAAAVTAIGRLTERVRALAAAGVLAIGERMAADLVHAVGTGTIITLLALPERQRSPALVTAAWDAVFAAITTGDPATRDPGPAAAANALRARLPETAALSDAERRLMDEWLDRIAAEGRTGPDSET